MTEEDTQQEEPSMEDILASIRRILSEEEEGGATDPGDAPVAAQPAPTPDPAPEPVAPPAPEEDILELTETMRLEPEISFPQLPTDPVVSDRTADVSSDALGALAKALLNRRDIAVGSRDLTLEGLVRELMRPLLREWLDQNLPYLIERLVKKEIDHMINRAERLDK